MSAATLSKLLPFSFFMFIFSNILIEIIPWTEIGVHIKYGVAFSGVCMAVLFIAFATWIFSSSMGLFLFSGQSLKIMKLHYMIFYIISTKEAKQRWVEIIKNKEEKICGKNSLDYSKEKS
jgi:hypothetical protein